MLATSGTSCEGDVAHGGSGPSRRRPGRGLLCSSSRKLVDRVVDHPVHRLAPPALDPVGDLHAPGRMEAGDLEHHGPAVGGEAGRRDLRRALVVMVRAVIDRPLDRPGPGGVARRVRRRLRVERIGEGQDHGILAGAQADGQEHRLARGADPVEAAGLGLVAGPGEHAARVELAVAGMEPAAHDAGREPRDRQGALAPLHPARRRPRAARRRPCRNHTRGRAAIRRAAPRPGSRSRPGATRPASDRRRW